MWQRWGRMLRSVLCSSLDGTQAGGWFPFAVRFTCICLLFFEAATRHGDLETCCGLFVVVGQQEVPWLVTGLLVSGLLAIAIHVAITREGR